MSLVWTRVFCRDRKLYNHDPGRLPAVINKDIRRVAEEDLKGFEAVVHLAEAMTSDGTPWRPLVHVLDICEAIVCGLEAPREMVHNEVFNVGNSQENYQVWKIAQIVSRTFPACEVTLGNNDGDNRSYRVSFDKISARLPGFQCRRTAEMGVNQLFELFERIRLTPEIFEFRAYTKQLQHLIQTHQIDGEFFWRPF
jgi:UDP-glucose 4-epimerase